MKKIFGFLTLCLACFSLQAQNHFSYSVEVAAGVGIGHGPLVTVTPQFVAQYELGSSFRLGAGVGVRFALPCVQYNIRNGERERTFCNEFDSPLFVRAGYVKEKFYANVDAGYAIGIHSFFGYGWIPGGKKETCYNGFFVKPHLGFKLGTHSALALGVLLQQSVVSDNVVRTETSITGASSFSYSVWQTVNTRNLLTPAITLHYAYLF